MSNGSRRLAGYVRDLWTETFRADGYGCRGRVLWKADALQRTIEFDVPPYNDAESFVFSPKGSVGLPRPGKGSTVPGTKCVWHIGSLPRMRRTLYNFELGSDGQFFLPDHDLEDLKHDVAIAREFVERFEDPGSLMDDLLRSEENSDTKWIVPYGNELATAELVAGWAIHLQDADRFDRALALLVEHGGEYFDDIVQELLELTTTQEQRTRLTALKAGPA